MPLSSAINLSALDQHNYVIFFLSYTTKFSQDRYGLLEHLSES